MEVGKLRKKFRIRTFKRWERHNIQIEEKQEQIIIGCLLGDGSISKDNRNSCHQSCLEFKQGPKQKDYLWWKYHQLKNLCISEPKELNNGQWRFRTVNHPVFSEMRKFWYPEKTKIISYSLIDKINILGLSVWFMDDGSNSNQGLFLKFCTCGFSYNENIILRNVLQDKFQIKSQIRIYGGYNHLVIETGNRLKFINLIKPFIVPCLNYKLNIDRLEKMNELP